MSVLFNRLRLSFRRLRDRQRPLQDRFSYIYAEHRWSGGGDETRSGAGSTLGATETIRDLLPELLKELNVSGLLDLGCGDFNWMKEVALPTFYLGVDIVPQVIEENRQKYQSESVKFMVLDGASDPLPKGYGMILCREVLFHLSFDDGAAVIEQIRNSGATWVLTTTSSASVENTDIVSGGFRNVDLQKPPYGFPPPLEVLKDDAVSASRYLGLWRVKDLELNR